jgi:hypothetical protein
MADMGWQAYVDNQENAEEYKWLCRMYDECVELAEYPHLKADATMLRDKIGYMLVHQMMQSTTLDGGQVTSVLINIGVRAQADKKLLDSVESLLRIAREEIKKEEGK